MLHPVHHMVSLADINLICKNYHGLHLDAVYLPTILSFIFGGAIYAIVHILTMPEQVDGTYSYNLESLVHKVSIIAHETGEEPQKHRLRASSLQSLSAMVIGLFYFYCAFNSKFSGYFFLFLCNSLSNLLMNFVITWFLPFLKIYTLTGLLLLCRYGSWGSFLIFLLLLIRLVFFWLVICIYFDSAVSITPP